MNSTVQASKASWNSEDAPCVKGCPVKALARNDDMGRVEVDYDVFQK